MKVVINQRYGGFSVSNKFMEHYGIPISMAYDIDRYDSRLIEYIETYGSEAASGWAANLVIVDIPPETYYRINEYDGYEFIEYRDEVEWLVAN